MPAVNRAVCVTFDGLSPVGLINLTSFGVVLLRTARPLRPWFGTRAAAAARPTPS